MSFERQTAGRMMSPQFVPVHGAATAGGAIARLPAAEAAGRVTILYVVDDPGRLIGRLPIGRLIKAEPGVPLRRAPRESGTPLIMIRHG